MSGCMNCVSCGAPSCERVTALEAKCDLLAASLRKADADLATWQAESAFRQQLADDYKAERDQARAVLAETPENIAIVAGCVGLTGTWHHLATATLAALRARAELEPTQAADQELIATMREETREAWSAASAWRDRLVAVLGEIPNAVGPAVSEAREVVAGRGCCAPAPAGELCRHCGKASRAYVGPPEMAGWRSCDNCARSWPAGEQP